MVDAVKTLVTVSKYLLHWFGKFTIGRLDWDWFVLWIRVEDGYHVQASHDCALYTSWKSGFISL